jgi:hypothetical protein
MKTTNAIEMSTLLHTHSGVFAKVNLDHCGSNPDLKTKSVSEWFDTDSARAFLRTVCSGDVVELRNNNLSHWGVAVRIRQSPSPNRKGKSEQAADEVMIFHLIHSAQTRGQIGQFTIEEFWKPDCRIRINNTTNGMSMYGNSHNMPRSDVLCNAFTAYKSSTMKWQTCSDFIRWSCEHDEGYSAPSTSSSASSSHSLSEGAAAS